ncbi:hypothetical protein V8C44DRAFT_342286 [Trichoderma aethiopicum]
MIQQGTHTAQLFTFLSARMNVERARRQYVGAMEDGGRGRLFGWWMTSDWEGGIQRYHGEDSFWFFLFICICLAEIYLFSVSMLLLICLFLNEIFFHR